MAGRPGRSGGHNKLSLEEHLLRGTYNATRHRHLAAAVTATATATAEPVPAELLEGLASRGKAFVEECWGEYEGWTSSKRALLREAGVLLDQLETLRGQRGERAAQRLLVSVVAALRFEQAGRLSAPEPAPSPLAQLQAQRAKWTGRLK